MKAAAASAMSASPKPKRLPAGCASSVVFAALAAFLAKALVLWYFSRVLLWGDATPGDELIDTENWLFGAYLTQSQVKPLSTRMYTSFLIFLCSDVIVQCLPRRTELRARRRFSISRALRFSGFGVFIATPLLYSWHIFLDDLLSPELGNIYSAGIAAVCNQLYFTPTYTALYFIYDAILQDRGLAFAYAAMRRSGLNLILSTWVFWLPANTINFFLVPRDQRVLFITSLGLIWNIYFAYLTDLYLPSGTATLRAMKKATNV